MKLLSKPVMIFCYNYDLVQNKGTVDVNAKMVDLKEAPVRVRKP